MLFTFPSRYWSAIGLSRVFSLTGWSPLIHAEFLVLRATQDTAGVLVPSDTRLSLSVVPLSRGFSSVPSFAVSQSYYPNEAGTSVVWALACSLAATCAIIVYFLFLRVLRCFSSPRSPHHKVMACLQHAGLSHSEVCGSMIICISPQLFAAYHVLHRL